MHTAARRHIRSILLLLLLGCSGDPTGPGGGALSVSIQGLPFGSAAAVSISGPNGYGQSLTSSQTLAGLAPGAYTVTASDVTVGAAPYQGSPPSQVVVVSNGSPANASVTYATPAGNIALTVSGLGTSSSAVVTVTGPGSYTQSVTSTRTLSGLTPGTYTIEAQNVAASCGSTFSVSPTTQNVAVTASATANATISYSPTASGLVNLCVDGMYVTQSAQNYAGTVPLVQNRDGLLRVFVVADQQNTPASAVQVQLRFYPPGGGSPSIVPLSPPVGMVSVPTAPDESSLSNSWNYAVPAGTILPGLRIEVEVDPANVVTESIETDNVLAPPAPNVRTVPTLNVTFVPVLQKGIPIGRRIPGNVTAGNAASFMQVTQGMYPIDAYNTAVHAPYTTTTFDTLQDDNGNNAWGTILGEIDFLQTTEGSSRYYYGVAKVSYFNGVAGVAYVSDPAAFPPQVARASLGWDYLPSGSIVVAHELGHNWARNHAPCGGPSGIDLNYPNADGTTGGYGYDMSTTPDSLRPPTRSDIMGYCDPKWISAYTYVGVLNYLSPVGPLVQGRAVSTAVQPCLVVWGHIRNGELVLEPAFEVNTRPSLPRQAGPYSLEGRAPDGSPVFSLSFAPKEIADAPGSQRNFVFAVPLSSARASRLASLHLSGRGRPAILAAATAVSGAQPGTQSEAVDVRRLGAGHVGLRWDARAHPMIMVRDAETGEVLSVARGGEVQLSTLKGHLDLVISDGVKSRVKRVAVSP